MYRIYAFFLLAASTFVEVVDSHQGFRVVTNQIKTVQKGIVLDDWVFDLFLIFHIEQLNSNNRYGFVVT
jgi:hypothetical protein